MKKQEILKILKKHKRLSTTKISNLIRCDYNYTLKLLGILEKEKKIIKETETNSIYWRVI